MGRRSHWKSSVSTNTVGRAEGENGCQSKGNGNLITRCSICAEGFRDVDKWGRTQSSE